MLETEFRCWWHLLNVGARRQCKEKWILVTKKAKPSPISLSCHQYISSPTSMWPYRHWKYYLLIDLTQTRSGNREAWNIKCFLYFKYNIYYNLMYKIIIWVNLYISSYCDSRGFSPNTINTFKPSFSKFFHVMLLKNVLVWLLIECKISWVFANLEILCKYD